MRLKQREQQRVAGIEVQSIDIEEVFAANRAGTIEYASLEAVDGPRVVTAQFGRRGMNQGRQERDPHGDLSDHRQVAHPTPQPELTSALPPSQNDPSPSGQPYGGDECEAQVRNSSVDRQRQMQREPDDGRSEQK